MILVWILLRLSWLSRFTPFKDSFVGLEVVIILLDNKLIYFITIYIIPLSLYVTDYVELPIFQ